MRRLLLAFALSACSTPQDATLPDRYRACSQPTDCTAIGTACDDCCRYTGVNTLFEAEARAAVTRQCAGYDGGVCDCNVIVLGVDCVDAVCTAITGVPDTGS